MLNNANLNRKCKAKAKDPALQRYSCRLDRRTIDPAPCRGYPCIGSMLTRATDMQDLPRNAVGLQQSIEV